jgi:hypothetical protein
MTTCHFGEPEANIVADLIADVLDAPTDISIIATVAQKAQSHCDGFPVYAKLGRVARSGCVEGSSDGVRSISDCGGEL